MSDTSGHVAPASDERHSVTLRQLETQLLAASVLMSRRQLMRHCQAGTFDAKKLPATNNIMEWFIAPASIEKGIADIKTLQEHRARRDATRPDKANGDASETASTDNVAVSGHDGSHPDTTESRIEPKRDIDITAVARHDASQLDIFEHPYVKRLEDRIDKLEAKYEAQVRRTEEIQIRSQEKLLELQRMTAVGQSQTLADFMIKAKDWILGQGPTNEEPKDAAPAT